MLDCLLRYIQLARLSNEIKYPDMEITAALIGAIQVMMVSDPMSVATSPEKQKMMRDTFEYSSNRGAQTLWSIGRELLDLTNKVFEKAFADRVLRMQASQEKKQRSISFLRSNALLSLAKFIQLLYAVQCCYGDNQGPLLKVEGGESCCASLTTEMVLPLAKYGGPTHSKVVADSMSW